MTSWMTRRARLLLDNLKRLRFHVIGLDKYSKRFLYLLKKQCFLTELYIFPTDKTNDNNNDINNNNNNNNINGDNNYNFFNNFNDNNTLY